MRISRKLSVSVEHHGFLTFFKDVTNLPAWCRRWCWLKDAKLYYWEYPEDEHKKNPIGHLDLEGNFTWTSLCLFSYRYVSVFSAICRNCTPDDITPAGIFTKNVQFVNREKCARPFTFLLSTLRPALPGDADSLIMKTNGIETTIEYVSSFDLQYTIRYAINKLLVDKFLFSKRFVFAGILSQLTQRNWDCNGCRN